MLISHLETPSKHDITPNYHFQSYNQFLSVKFIYINNLATRFTIITLNKPITPIVYISA